jgi:hypothetical protein
MTNPLNNEEVVVRKAKCICGSNQFRALTKYLDTKEKIVSISYACVECGEQRLSLSHQRM